LHGFCAAKSERAESAFPGSRTSHWPGSVHSHNYLILKENDFEDGDSPGRE
jgi:hypothetical protein